jgi:hypothetical protein
VKFIRAFHKKDAEGVQQTIGVAEDGQVWLRVTGWTDDDEPGYANARFDPDEALRLAFELANLARYGRSVQGHLVAHVSGECWCGDVHDLAAAKARNRTRYPYADGPATE